MADYPISKEAFIKEIVELKEMLGNSYASIAVSMVLDRLNGFPQFETPAPEWISVEERPPKSNECVAVLLEREYHSDNLQIPAIGQYRYAGYWILSDNFPGAKVTHWFPLPKAKKEDAHG